MLYRADPVIPLGLCFLSLVGLLGYQVNSAGTTDVLRQAITPDEHRSDDVTKQANAVNET